MNKQHLRSSLEHSIGIFLIVMLMLAIVPVLIALTIAENGDWTAPEVIGGFAMGAVFLVVFVLVENRAEDPVIPLGLFRNPTFAVSAIATFFATFGFATAIIFLPLWFQVVQGASSTASGYDLFPFLFGLIASSVASGQIVSRTGHYKWLLVGSMALVAVGLTLFTNLRTEAAWRLRNRLDPQHVPDLRAPHSGQTPFAIPNAPWWQRLREELAPLTYELAGRQTKLLPKKDWAEILGHSPDVADALIQTFASL